MALPSMPVMWMPRRWMFSTTPPRPRAVLKRRPISVPMKVQFCTSMLRTPPDISLPMVTPPGCPVDGAILDQHILGRHAEAAAGLVHTGLDAEAVVAGGHDAAAHVDAPAGVDVQGVAVLRPAVVEDLHVAQGDVFAQPRVDRPVGRVAEGDALEEHAAALEEADQARAEENPAGLIVGREERPFFLQRLHRGRAGEAGRAGAPLVALGS